MTVPGNLRRSFSDMRHPFSLRPNKQDAVVTVSGTPWQPESATEYGPKSGKFGRCA
jgi:hypothetical protein